MALSLALSQSFRRVFPAFADAAGSCSGEWYEQGEEYLEGLTGDFFSLLCRFAIPLGLVEADDYSAVTMELRQVTAESLESHTRAVAETSGLSAERGATPARTLERFFLDLGEQVGWSWSDDSEGRRRIRRECEVAMRVAAGGDLHARFWHWLDRFHYETYQPWRSGRAEYLRAERDRAVAALGGDAGDGAPGLQWLPRQNPLARATDLRDHAASGSWDVVFWSEPFCTWDIVHVLPHGLLVSFGFPGEAYEGFRRRADELASRLKALADPTRLTIMRIIRQREVDNTDIADYLELSHPTISVHAKTLREAGLVHSRKDGRRLMHRIDPTEVRELMRELEDFLGLPPE